MDDTLVIATGNRHKLHEITELLKECPVRLLSLADFPSVPEPREDGTRLQDNAIKKARHYARLFDLPCLADDTGLFVEALEGRPGIQTARYAGPGATGRDNCDKLLGELAGISRRTAYFSCVIAIALPQDEVRMWEGRCEGEILPQRCGDSEFGYDPLFFVPNLKKTFAELPLEEINRISHRSRAMAELIATFDQVLTWMRHGSAAPS